MIRTATSPISAKGGHTVSCAYIHNLLQQHVSTPELYTILDEILQQPGRAFSASARWVSLVRDTAHTLGGDHPAVPMAAAAVEFTVAATDVVDDLADAEWPSAAITPARALNATLLLSHLSHQVVTDLGEQIGAAQARQISQAITTGMATACVGEDADLRFETLPTVTLEAAHTMTMQKSGALMGMAPLPLLGEGENRSPMPCTEMRTFALSAPKGNKLRGPDRQWMHLV
jgi:geranylgeranyl pyrophosphate synthase